MKLLHTFPDEFTKTVSGTPITFYAQIEHEGPYTEILAEIWTDINCKQSNNQYYAAKLMHVKTEGNIHFFEREIIPTHAGFHDFIVRYRKYNVTRWNWSSKTIIFVEPEFVNDLIVYNAFVRQFGAIDMNNDGIIQPGEGGTFDDLVKGISHFKKLGINALYLNPIQISGEGFRYEGESQWYDNEPNMLPLHMHPGSVYQIKDYKSIDPELGINPMDDITDQYKEFKRAVSECHKHNIRIIIDMVFDHTSKDSVLIRLHPEWFLYKKEPESFDSPYINEHEDPEHKIWGKPEYVCSPYDHGMFWGDCAQLNWNFVYAPAPNDNPKNPGLNEMKKYFLNILRYWIKHYGVDGFRLDVSYAVPTEFWNDAVSATRKFAQKIVKFRPEEIAPLSSEILFIGESYVDKIEELQSCGITAINGDFSMKIFTVEQLKGYLDYAYNIDGKFFPNGTKWLLFPECHDFHRLPKKFDGQLHHDYSDVQLAKSRWVLSAMLPGIPMLHNGYEVIQHDQVSVRSYSPINWKSKKNISDYIGKVNRIRNENKAFEGKYIFVPSEQGETSNAQLYSFLRHYDSKTEKQAFLIVVNMDFNNIAEYIKISLPTISGYDFEKIYVIYDHLTDRKYERRGANLTIHLGPGESHIFEIIQN